MTRRSKLWWAAGVLFTVINAAGAIYAAALGEVAHSSVHVVLLFFGPAAYLIWRLGPWGRRQDPATAQVADARVEYLQQSVDAMALELERLGEAQRYREKLQAAQGQTAPLKKDL